MRRFVFVCLAAMLLLPVTSCKKDPYGKSYGENGLIRVNGELYEYTRGHLGEVLDEVMELAGDPNAIESLVWKGGSISGKDIDYMRSKLKNSLVQVDLREASFFVSDEVYSTGLSGSQGIESIVDEHSIPIAMFRDFKKLESVDIMSVDKLDRFSFSNTPALSIFNIHFVRTIEYCAFISSGIDTIYLPEGLTTIGDEAFYGVSLSVVSLPSTVTSFHDTSFIKYKGTSSLEVFYCEAKTPPVVVKGTADLNDQNNVFNRVRDDLVIKVPAKSVEAYKNADLWSKHADAIVAID